jgi:hypothetical protein
MVINSPKRTITSHLHWTQKKTTSDVGNPGPDLEQAHKCDGVELVNGIPNPTFDNCISNGNTQTI